jgi:glycosyltransferase involved in cell wall biosynthesis
VSAPHPKVSICIPTYNRAPYLRLLLRDFFADPPQTRFELVICDNGSTDDTPELLAEWAARTPKVRVFRQSSNVGPYANMMTAFRLARGEYSVYLADDDRLINSAVDEGIDFLDRFPELAAYYASHEFWDDLTKTSHGVSYPISEEHRFSKLDSIALLNYIIRPANLPEIGIYRSSALQRVTNVPIKASFSLTNVADILEFGDICFRPVHFYRYLIRHEIPNPPGHSVGQRGVLHELDAYRSGLQYLAAKAYQYVGYNHVPQGDLAALNSMIEACLDSSLVNATNVLIGWREYRGAYEFLLRQMVRGWFPESQAEYFRANLVPGVVAQAAIEIFEGMSVVDRFALFAIPDLEKTLGLLEQLRPGFAVDTLAEPGIHDEADRSRTFVLTDDENSRVRLIEAGFEPGLVVSQADLARKYQL